MDEAYRPIILDLFRDLPLTEQHHISLVCKIEASKIKRPQRVESLEYIFFDHRPCGLKE
jgi:hypothetical protein